MKKQDLENHTRIHPLFHYFLAPVSALASAFCLFWLLSGFDWVKILFGLVFLLIHLTAFVARGYAKKNQDRIIRNELRFRYFLLTNRDFTPVEEELSMAQLAALRFAGDTEFGDLTSRDDLRDISPRQIKESIKSWKADLMRV